MVKIKGFTLIELMVVVAILGILASVIFPAIKDRHANPPDINTDETDSTSSIIINGVKHKCDTVGNCDPIE